MLDTRCVLYEQLDEDGGHLFFKCKRVRWVWTELQLEHARIHLAALNSAEQVIEKILKLREEVQGRVITYLP